MWRFLPVSALTRHNQPHLAARPRRVRAVRAGTVIPSECGPDFSLVRWDEGDESVMWNADLQDETD
jgi:hypothetical protein